MKNLILVLLILLSWTNVQAAFEYDEYLNKVSPELEMKTKFFKNLDYNQEALTWLDKVDLALDPESYGTYNASFFLGIDEAGNITGIEIEELRETDPESFKAFIAKLAAFRFPALPKGLENTIFNLDARTLYIDRKIELSDSVEVHKLKTSSNSIASLEMTDKELSLKLLEPRYLDYPVLGEELVFLNEEDASVIRSRVVNVEKNKIKVLAHQIKHNDDIYHLNLAFDVERPRNNSHETLRAVLESGFGAATIAGIGSSISSHSIMPGAFALMGMTGAALEEHEKVKSFDFVRGDKISLTKSEDK